MSIKDKTVQQDKVQYAQSGSATLRTDEGPVARSNPRLFRDTPRRLSRSGRGILVRSRYLQLVTVFCCYAWAAIPDGSTASASWTLIGGACASIAGDSIGAGARASLGGGGGGGGASRRMRGGRVTRALGLPTSPVMFPSASPRHECAASSTTTIAAATVNNKDFIPTHCNPGILFPYTFLTSHAV